MKTKPKKLSNRKLCSEHSDLARLELVRFIIAEHADTLETLSTRMRSASSAIAAVTQDIRERRNP